MKRGSSAARWRSRSFRRGSKRFWPKRRHSMPGWQAATGRRMKRPDRRRSNPSPPSDDKPQRRAEDAASDCDPPEGHAVAAAWNTFDVHPEKAGYKGERQEDKREQRGDQQALVGLLGTEKIGRAHI